MFGIFDARLLNEEHLNESDVLKICGKFSDYQTDRFEELNASIKRLTPMVERGNAHLSLMDTAITYYNDLMSALRRSGLVS